MIFIVRLKLHVTAELDFESHSGYTPEPWKVSLSGWPLTPKRCCFKRVAATCCCPVTSTVSCLPAKSLPVPPPSLIARQFIHYYCRVMVWHFI